MKVRARIVDYSLVPAGYANYNLRSADPNKLEFCEYSVEVPANLSKDLCMLVGQGLFFENDWSRDETISYIWVEEE